MKIVESPHEAYAHTDHWRKENLRVGLVPTMGALHPGHFSLVERSRSECDVTVASIFVNPTQFAPNEDLSTYPRTLEQDFQGLKDLGVDLVFVPRSDEIYPEDFSTFVTAPHVARMLEGEHRPDHFQGVVTVVLKLFHILPAHISYFGQKDYQQLAVIRQMVEDLNVPIRVVGCPTVRESDGLAMSSRNRYLSEEEREHALSLSQALARVQDMVDDGNLLVSNLESAMRECLREHTDSIDYARVVDAKSLKDLEIVAGEAVALIAAHVGTTRLIDNRLLDLPAS